MLNYNFVTKLRVIKIYCNFNCAFALAEPCGVVKIIIYFIYVTGLRVIKNYCKF